MKVKLFSVFLLVLAIANCQENAGSNVADALIECYDSADLRDRDNRPPSSINVLIDLIRRVEDGKSAQDARSLAVELIHRFRQDGIREFQNVTIYSIPYSPKGYQFDKTRLLLTRFIPGTGVSFPNETLNKVERCSMHFMLSNTFEMKRRGDEMTVCNKLMHYQSRVKRDTEDTESNSDVETVLPDVLPKGYGVYTNISECPVENGVVYTKFGAIQAGTVIAAIASALENQVVKEESYSVDSIFASTLSSDIVETALIQGLSKGQNEVEVGLGGGWKNSLVPKWYYLDTKKKGYEMTDAEIRADIDGLIIGKNLNNWRNKFSGLKISQILDMYYSGRGVFSKEFRACNRNTHAKSYDEDLTTQSLAFAFAYNKIATFEGTIVKDAMRQMVQPAIDKYKKYYGTINDVSCEAQNSIQRVATELTIVLDANWPYEYLYSAVSYVLDNIDVNKYESNYTVLNGNTGEVIVKWSNSILDFHEIYTQANHTAQSKGFDATKSMQAIQAMYRTKSDFDKSSGNVGGRSSVVLSVVYAKTIPADQAGFFADQRQSHFTNYYPDVKFMVFGAGEASAYSSLASNADDIFKIDDSMPMNDIKTSIHPSINKIAEVPRKIVNPRCGYSMDGDASSNSIALFVEPGVISYYKVAPHYIYGEGPRSIKVRADYGAATFCMSRSDSKAGNSASGSNCKPLTTNVETFDLTDACVVSVSECEPFYFSLQAPENATIIRCTEKGCRYPDNSKVTLTVDGLGCASSSNQIGAGFVVVAVMVYLLKVW